MVDVKVVSRPMEEALRRLGEEAGRAPEMERAKRQIGTVELQAQRREFIERSRPGHPAWHELSWVTIVLRRRGRGGKIYSSEDVERRRARTPKLRDRGLLLASLQPGAPGNILETEEFAIHIGTSRPEAATHQEGGHSTFVFDEERQAQFERNVSMTLKGKRRPKQLEPGHRYRWGQADNKRHGPWHHRKASSPWNQAFFVMRNYLRKISGTSRRIPKREIIHEPPPDRLERHASLVERGLQALADRLGL